jgi:hypothetical protein
MRRTKVFKYLNKIKGILGKLIKLCSFSKWIMIWDIPKWIVDKQYGTGGVIFYPKKLSSAQ